MSERSIRVNELILREISHILRTRYRDQSIAITLTEVSVSPDLRNARIYYSVIGDERAKIKARSFFTKEYRNLQRMVSQVVVLKYFPKLNFVEDQSLERGSRVLDLLQSIDGETAPLGAYPDDTEYADDDGGAFDSDSDTAETGEADAGGEYVFDEDDLEYARDIEADAAASFDDEDGDFEAFDEEDDVAIEGDIDAFLASRAAEDEDEDEALDDEDEDGDDADAK